MIAALWDMNGVETNFAIPNIYAMKIASYHKQKEDQILWCKTSKDYLNYKYDVLYIFNESEEKRNPPLSLVNDSRTKLIGNFKLRRTYEIPSEVYRCRPDYSLYPKDTNIQRSDMVLLFDGRGWPIKDQQDFKNTYTRKYTMVCDKDLWKKDKGSLKTMIKSLEPCKNVNFLYPISLKTLIDDEELTTQFFKLKIIAGSDLKFTNDVGYDSEAAQNIAAWMERWKDSFNTKIPSVQFPLIVYNHHYNNSKIWKDFERDIKIIDINKQYKLNFIFSELETGQTAYVDLFNFLTKLISSHYSFIELVALPTSMQWNVSIQTVLMDHKYWYDDFLNNTLILIYRHQEWWKYFSHQFGNEYYRYEYVNWDEIKKIE